MYIYLFIVWLVELECKLRIIVWIFKCISDLYGIIEVERVWKYDKLNCWNNVWEYCFMKINIFDGNYKI